MARSQIRQSEALRRARERQRELDRQEDEARDASRARIADASAAVIVALERRADAERVLAAATSAVGKALRALLAEDLDADRAAALLELDATEIRRLLKATSAGASAEHRPAASPVKSARPSTATATPGSAGDVVAKTDQTGRSEAARRAS